MKALVLLLLLIVPVSAQTPAADRAVEGYKSAMEKLTKKYDTENAKPIGNKEKLKQIYKKQSDEISSQYAPVVIKELGRVQEAKDAALAEALQTRLQEVFQIKAGTILTGGKFMEVDSERPAVKIGSFSEGTKIQIQYVSGTWNVYPGAPMENPDTTNNGYCNLSLRHQAISGEWTTIEKNIKHTLDKPYEHETKIRGSYYIVISGSVGNKHEGVTTWQVLVSKP